MGVWVLSFGWVGVDFWLQRVNFVPMEVKFGLWYSNIMPLGVDFSCLGNQFGILGVV